MSHIVVRFFPCIGLWLAVALTLPRDLSAEPLPSEAASTAPTSNAPEGLLKSDSGRDMIIYNLGTMVIENAVLDNSALKSAADDNSSTPAIVRIPELSSAPARESKNTRSSMLCQYKPTYFLVFDAFDRAEAKFQVSVKYPLWRSKTIEFRCVNDATQAGRIVPYVTYTQKSLWRIGDESAPFSESNYNPSAFFQLNPPSSARISWWLPRLSAGIEHESNGQDVGSRSWNRFFGAAEVLLKAKSTDSGVDVPFVGIFPKIWYVTSWQLIENQDIAEYLGYGEIIVVLHSGQDRWLTEKLGRFELEVATSVGDSLGPQESMFRTGLTWNPGSKSEFWLSLDWFKFTPYLYIQYFRGAGETLLTYDEVDNQALRFGVRIMD